MRSLLSFRTPFSSFLSTSTKFVSLSELIDAGLPYSARNLRNASRKSSVGREVATSRCTAVVGRQMKRAGGSPVFISIRFPL